MSSLAALSIASNSEPRPHIGCALAALAARFGALTCSGTWAGPAAAAGEGEYWNLAVTFRCALEWRALRAELRAVEARCGRVRDGRGAVAIDLDLLLLGDTRVTAMECTLPAPAIHDVPYVLLPLAEVLPDWRDGDADEPLAARAVRCPRGTLRYLGRIDYPTTRDAARETPCH